MGLKLFFLAVFIWALVFIYTKNACAPVYTGANSLLTPEYWISLLHITDKCLNAKVVLDIVKYICGILLFL